MNFAKLYPLIMLGLKWIGLIGVCIKAKKAAGDTIDVFDYMECAATTLPALEDDFKPLVAPDNKGGFGKLGNLF